MKNGLIQENDQLIYYRDDEPYHAGVVEIDGDIYYIGKGGVAATGEHIVHREMTNGLLKRGTYRFGEDGKLVADSYLAPKKHRRRSKQQKHRTPVGITKPVKEAPSPSRTLRTVLIVCLADIAILLLVLLVVSSGMFDTLIGSGKPNNEPEVITVSLFFPEEDEEELLCSAGAKLLYDGKVSAKDAITISANPYRPLSLDYNITKSGTLTLSEYADLSSPMEFVLSASDKTIKIHNLTPDTTYYYRVVVADEVLTGSFKTAPSFRFISVPGVYNTRDIGGYTTEDGKKVKYGKIIRGTEIDGLVSPDYFLPHSSIENVSGNFAFAYDFDLRSGDVYKGTYYSRLGNNVRHKFYNSPSYGGIFHKDCVPLMKEIFTDLAKPENYPMYLHCTYGADRTGTIVFLLQGLLGVPLDKMITEYRLTGDIDKDFGESERMDVIVAGLQPYKGDTLQEKIEDYLISYVGLSPDDVASIKNILLETE